jgi:hypothetical protein
MNPKKKINKLRSQKHNRALIDYDEQYLSSLSPAELEFLAQFTDEYYAGADPILHTERLGKTRAQECKRTTNKARYKRGQDALNETLGEVTGATQVNDLDPEKLLLIDEACTESKKS